MASSLNATVIFGLVQSELKPGQNLFATVASLLRSSFRFDAPSGTYAQLYVISGLLGLWQGVTVLFLVALQVIVWQLWDFSRGDRIHGKPNKPATHTALAPKLIDGFFPYGFFLQKVVIWLGFWQAALVSAWSLACSRALHIAKASNNKVPFYLSPWAVHLTFIVYPLLAIGGAFAGGIVTNSRYTKLLGSINRLLDSLDETALVSSSFDGQQQVAAIQAAIVLGDATASDFTSFFRGYNLCYDVSLGYDLLSWMICMLVSVPYLFRMHRSLYGRRELPALVPHKRTELSVAFMSASATVFLLSATALAYAISQAVAIAQGGGTLSFVQLADRRELISLWIFTVCTAPLCCVGLAQTVFEARTERAARRAGVRAAERDRESDPSSGGSSGGKAKGGGAGRTGRSVCGESAAEQVVVSIERVVDVDEVGVERIELGEPPRNEVEAEEAGVAGGVSVDKGGGAGMSERSLGV